MTKVANTKGFIKFKFPNYLWTTKTTHLVNSWLLFFLLFSKREQAVSRTGTAQSHPNHHLFHLWEKGRLCSFTAYWWEHAQSHSEGRVSRMLERWQAGTGSSLSMYPSWVVKEGRERVVPWHWKGGDVQLPYASRLSCMRLQWPSTCQPNIQIRVTGS